MPLALLLIPALACAELFLISHVSPNNGIIVQALVKPCVRGKNNAGMQSMSMVDNSTVPGKIEFDSILAEDGP
ncbi:hypothetical protein V8C42DRAFT_315996 [Trichoderma barbatum]